MSAIKKMKNKHGASQLKLAHLICLNMQVSLAGALSGENIGRDTSDAIYYCLGLTE